MEKHLLQIGKFGIGVMVFGIVCIMLGEIATAWYGIGNPYARETALNWGVMCGTVINQIGFGCLIVGLFWVVVLLAPVIIPKQQKQESYDFGGLLPAESEPIFELTYPHLIRWQYYGEPFKEFCDRVKAAKEQITIKTACLIALPYRRDTVLVIDGTGFHGETNRVQGELMKHVQYCEVDEAGNMVQVFDVCYETYPQYIAFVRDAVQTFNITASEFVRRFVRDSDGPLSEILAVGRSVTLSVLFLLLSVNLSAGIVEKIKDKTPASVVEKVPAKGTAVVYSFDKITMERTADGVADVIGLLRKNPAFDNEAKYGEFNGLTIGGKMYGTVQIQTAAAVVGKDTAQTKPAKSLQQSVDEMDAATLEAVNELGKNGHTIAQSKTLDFLFFVLAFVAIAARAMAKSAAKEGLLTGYGQSIFGGKFVLIAESLRVICYWSYWIFGLYLALILFWRCVILESPELMLSMLFSKATAAVLFLLALFEILSNGSSRFVPNIKVDRERGPQVFTNSNRQLPG